MRQGALRAVALALAVCTLLASLSTRATAQGATVVVTAQLLDYEKGFIILTTGDGFRVAPDAVVTTLGSASAAPAEPHARDFARVTFDAAGTVTRVEISAKRLPAEGDLSLVHRFAVALSTPAPNPDLAGTPAGACPGTPGMAVTVSITVRVPATTQAADAVYMTTDKSGWNPQAYRMDRVDTLHYRTYLKLNTGTELLVLFDRNGTSQSIQRAENGLQERPKHICVRNDGGPVLSEPATVWHWGDEQFGNSLSLPQSIPTPFNPAPFPNLPPTPHP